MDELLCLFRRSSSRFASLQGKLCDGVQTFFPYGSFAGFLFKVTSRCGSGKYQVLTCPERVIDDYDRVTEFRKGI